MNIGPNVKFSLAEVLTVATGKYLADQYRPCCQLAGDPGVMTLGTVAVSKWFQPRAASYFPWIEEAVELWTSLNMDERLKECEDRTALIASEYLSPLIEKYGDSHDLPYGVVTAKEAFSGFEW